MNFSYKLSSFIYTYVFVLFKASYRLCVSGTEAFEQRAKETLTSRTFFFSQVLESSRQRII